MSQQLTEDEEVTVQALYNEGTCPWKFPFVENDQFLHLIQNTTERHCSHGQWSFLAQQKLSICNYVSRRN